MAETQTIAVLGAGLPLVRTIRERLEQGAEAHPDHDMSATYLTSAPPEAVD